MELKYEKTHEQLHQQLILKDFHMKKLQIKQLQLKYGVPEHLTQQEMYQKVQINKEKCHISLLNLLSLNTFFELASFSQLILLMILQNEHYWESIPKYESTRSYPCHAKAEHAIEQISSNPNYLSGIIELFWTRHLTASNLKACSSAYTAEGGDLTMSEFSDSGDINSIDLG